MDEDMQQQDDDNDEEEAEWHQNAVLQCGTAPIRCAYACVLQYPYTSLSLSFTHTHVNQPSYLCPAQPHIFRSSPTRSSQHLHLSLSHSHSLLISLISLAHAATFPSLLANTA